MVRSCPDSNEDCGSSAEAVTEVPSGAKTELNDVGGEGDDVMSALNVEGSGEEVEDVVDRVSRGFEAESAAVQRARSVVISRSISAILASSGSTVLDGGMQGGGGESWSGRYNTKDSAVR